MVNGVGSAGGRSKRDQMPKQIRLNAFDMNCVVHQSPGLWTHPRDRADRYNTLDYWVELAKLLERGKFDALFLADVLGVYDVYRGCGKPRGELGLFIESKYRRSREPASHLPPRAWSG